MKSAAIGRLFGAAAGRCSMCRMTLFEGDVKIGEMAHIIAKSKDGPRGNGYKRGEDDYSNLILLCANHHRVIDKDEDNWPPEKLHELKRNHEAWVEQSLAEYSSINRDIKALRRLMANLPFSKLKYAFSLLPIYFKNDIVCALDVMDALPIDEPQCRPFNDGVLEERYANFHRSMAALFELVESESDSDYMYVNPEYAADFLVINKNLPYDKKSSLKNRMSAAGRDTEAAYDDLLFHLRSAYPEVDLASFRCG